MFLRRVFATWLLPPPFRCLFLWSVCCTFVESASANVSANNSNVVGADALSPDGVAASAATKALLANQVEINFFVLVLLIYIRGRTRKVWFFFKKKTFRKSHFFFLFKIIIIIIDFSSS